MSRPIFTIGHSTHPLERLLELLQQHGVLALYDVRSSPYSAMNPQFNRDVLQSTLPPQGIEYVFLGRELGARSDDPACYVNGRVSYERLAQTEAFQRGLNEVLEAAKSRRLALMCAEKDPLACHRTILVSRHLAARGARIEHILDDGSLESHERAIRRLLRLLKMEEHDLFRTREEIIEDAYLRQGERIGYRQAESGLDDELQWSDEP